MNFFKKPSHFLLAIASGILLIAAWPTVGFAPLLFIAFVPLLILENNIEPHNTTKVFKYSYLTFFIWNVGTTWWIYYSSLGGAILAIVFNSLFMAMVFVFYHTTKSALGATRGFISLIIYWIGFECLHLNWDLSWPWLTLGNGFSTSIKWIQWYEYTGALGGSLWILTANILVFKLVQKRWQKLSLKKTGIYLALFLLIPFFISLGIYYSYEEKSNPVAVAVVQPNIDPYTEKFGNMPSSEQLNILLRLATTVTDSTTDYLVGPETAIPEGIWEDHLRQSEYVKTIRLFNKRYPHLKTILGISSNKLYRKGENISATARKFTNEDGYYDSYNTAIQIDNTDSIQVYHKSKLVLGVEMIPYPFIFKHLEKLAINLGGTTGSLGTQKERSVFTSPKKDIKIAPVICYESIYGDYTTGYIKNGANLIFIITNDGWWDDSPGYKQHLSYASLRAIENRRSIARSANTGISCFINQRGEVSMKTTWWQPAAIKGTINANNTLTFYSKYGDVIGKLCGILALLLIPFTIFTNLRRFK